MERAWQQGSPDLSLSFGCGSNLRKCASMYENTNESTKSSLRKCLTSPDMPVVDEYPDTQDALAHIIARPDGPVLKRRESERTLPTSPLAQLFSNNQRKSGENSRILLNITMRGSSGPLKVIVDSDSGPIHVIKQALAVYAREGRLPVLLGGSDAYELYCGHDTSKAVLAEQRIKSFGHRKFLMCPRHATLSSTTKQAAGSREHVHKNKTTAFFMSYYVHITL